MKRIVLSTVVLLVSLSSYAQVYGTFYGAHLYAYKSNLFNSDDFRADSFQTYSITPGFGGSLEYGYLYENGFSISGGISFGTNNQNYKGSHPQYIYSLKAQTKTSFIKIPLTFSKQLMLDKKLRYIYSLGFYYSYNTGYSDKITLDYTSSQVKDYQSVIAKDGSITSNFVGDTFKTTYQLGRNIMNRHGLGVLAGMGANYKIGEKTDLMMQVRMEFTFTNAEYNQEIVHTPTGTTALLNENKPLLKYPYGNHAKYMNAPNANHNRASTHPFNLGISIGIRHFLFDF